MCSQNLMLRQIRASVGVNAPLHIPYYPTIASVTKFSTTSACNGTHQSTYEKLHRHFLTQNESKKKWYHTRNILCHFLEWCIRFIY